jgi:hypothetical protein
MAELLLGHANLNNKQKETAFPSLWFVPTSKTQWKPGGNREMQYVDTCPQELTAESSKMF